ncbi:hypothetical protein [Burkholderia sp. WSM2230]|uniref:hypothetical protein n=1 Tax=Burkholderia sp. WSM2230 TaxID=944435 RepID=UPI00042A7C23|nr:hypothetical protein [Burkholderia sp. WSM2230]
MLISCYSSGEAIRSRRVSDVVLSSVVDIPMPSQRVLMDWDRETSSRMNLEAGDVEVMPFARTRVRWSDYTRCVEAMSDWTGSVGLPEVLVSSDVALMACRGARYHHDAAQYGGAAFCNLFLTEDQGFDLHFASTGERIPLKRGTAVIFDTGQPHGVIRRDSSGFNADDFTLNRECVQIFLTWELPIENTYVARALNIDFDVAPWPSSQADAEQLLLNGEAVTTCPYSGRWLRAE